jgi:hypothetical protein
MPEHPFIDLHPDKLRGSGPEGALLACRNFLDEALRRGHKKVRIITGLGIHGDGSPRLRSRVEKEVLGAFFARIESQHYEQGGAVILLELKTGVSKPDKNYLAKSKKEAERQGYVKREERLMVALERLEAAGLYLDEGDLRRARLKLNQVLREFFPQKPLLGPEEEAIRKGLAALTKELDSLS